MLMSNESHQDLADGLSKIFQSDNIARVEDDLHWFFYERKITNREFIDICLDPSIYLKMHDRQYMVLLISKLADKLENNKDPYLKVYLFEKVISDTAKKFVEIKNELISTEFLINLFNDKLNISLYYDFKEIMLIVFNMMKDHNDFITPLDFLSQIILPHHPLDSINKLKYLCGMRYSDEILSSEGIRFYEENNLMYKIFSPKDFIIKSIEPHDILDNLEDKFNNKYSHNSMIARVFSNKDTDYSDNDIRTIFNIIGNATFKSKVNYDFVMTTFFMNMKKGTHKKFFSNLNMRNVNFHLEYGSSGTEILKRSFRTEYMYSSLRYHNNHKNSLDDCVDAFTENLLESSELFEDKFEMNKISMSFENSILSVLFEIGIKPERFISVLKTIANSDSLKLNYKEKIITSVFNRLDLYDSDAYTNIMKKIEFLKEFSDNNTVSLINDEEIEKVISDSYYNMYYKREGVQVWL